MGKRGLLGKAVCKAYAPGGKWNKWFTDHNHHNGQIRGELCNSCNLLLGHAKDNPEVLQSAIEYLTHWSNQPLTETNVAVSHRPKPPRKRISPIKDPQVA